MWQLLILRNWIIRLLFYLTNTTDLLHRPGIFSCGNTFFFRFISFEIQCVTGMSVAVGNFFGNGSAYAAGAPRSNGTGQVVLFTKHDHISDMEVTLVLDGEQFASSYGYEITSADVNGDK